MKNENELKKMQRASLVKMFVIVMIVVMFAVFGSVAWFTQSREVEGSGVQMTASDLPFEIKTVGDNIGPKSHVQTKENSEIIDTISNLFSKNPFYSGTNAFNVGTLINDEGYYSDGSNIKIQWHLTENVDEGGFGPDSSGILTFYIIPKQDGPLTAKFSLDLEGYTAVQTKNEDGTYAVTSLTRVSNSSSQQLQDSVKYLNGHILIFKDIK